MAFKVMWLAKIIQGENSWRRGLRREPWPFLGYFKVFFIRAKLLYNTVSLSPVQESELVIRSDQISRSVVSDSCDPMNCSTPGLPAQHQLSEFTETHAHRDSDAHTHTYIPSFLDFLPI